MKRVLGAGVILAGVFSALTGVAVAEKVCQVNNSYFVWPAIPNGGGSGWPTFQQRTLTVGRAANENLYLCSDPVTGAGVSVDDRIDMYVNGTGPIVVYHFGVVAKVDITAYVPVGTNTIRFDAVDESGSPCYCVTALYVLRTEIATPPVSDNNKQSGLVTTTDPINMSTGNLYIDENDLSVPCPGIGLSLSRRYNSIGSRTGSMGPGWTHNWDWRLINTNFNNESWSVLWTGSGRTMSFLKQTNGVYGTPSEEGGLLMATGSVIRYTLPGGLVYTFGTDGYLQGISDLWSNSVSLTYSNGAWGNLLTRVDHTNGQALTFTYKTNQLVLVSLPFTNWQVQYTYNTSGMLTGSVVTAGTLAKPTAYQWNGNLITQRINAVNEHYYYTYGTGGTGLSVQVENGYYLQTAAYNVTNIAGVFNSITYNWGTTNIPVQYFAQGGGTGLVSYFTTFGGTIWDGGVRKDRYKYDNWLRITNSFEEEFYKSVLSHYCDLDLFGRVIRSSDSLSGTNTAYVMNYWQYEWDMNLNLLTSLTDPTGAKVLYVYTNDKPAKITVKDGLYNRDTVYSYATNGMLVGLTNANGHSIRFFYDSYGFVTSSMPQVGPVVNMEWDRLGNLNKITEPGWDPGNLPRVTTIERDAFGRPSKIDYADPSLVSSFYYDAKGRITNQVDTAGRWTTYTYKPTGKLSSISRKFGATNITTSIEYDKQFNTLSVTDGKSRKVEQYTLDSQGRPVAISNLDGQTMTLLWGVNDYLAAATRFDGTRITNVFDMGGYLSMACYPGVTNYYNCLANGLLSSVSNTYAYSVSNTFDGRNLLSAQLSLSPFAAGTSVLTNRVQYLRDGIGDVTNRLVILPGSTNGTSYLKDEAERITCLIQDRGSTKPALFFKWNYNQYNGLVDTLSASNSGVKAQYKYDKMNRITGITWTGPSGRVIMSFAYTYNLAGMIDSELRETGELTRYEYDDLDRLTREKHVSAAGQTLFDETYSYDNAGNRITKQKGTYSLAWQCVSTNVNRLSNWTTAQAPTNLSATVYMHGRVNELIGTNSYFGYLWVSNCTAVTPFVDGTNFWVYDLPMNAGTQNIVAAIGDLAGNTTYVTNQAWVTVVTNAQYYMDAAGSVTTMVYSGCDSYSARRNMTWDTMYRLTWANTNGGLVTAWIAYDMLDRWTWAYIDAGGTFISAVYDGIHLAAEFDPYSNRLARSYTHGPGVDNVLAMTIHTGAVVQTFCYLTDIRGTVHALVDETGAVVEKYRYDAWGRVTGSFDGNNQPVWDISDKIMPWRSKYGNRFLFQGREFFWRTGLYNFRARWYDPITGRWLSNDPIGINGGLNQYAFCGSNPVNFTDPSGLSPEFSPGIGMWSGLTAGQHLGAARESAPFAGGVLAGMSGVGAVNGLAVWAVEVGISRGIVTGSLFTLAGVGAFGTFMDLYFDHSCDNIKYNAGLLLGGGSMASMSAGYLRGLLSPAGYTSSEATLASELGMAWRGPDGKISPAAFFSDWFNPNAPVNPMSTGPTVLGAAGASTLNSQGAGNMLR